MAVAARSVDETAAVTTWLPTEKPGLTNRDRCADVGLWYLGDDSGDFNTGLVVHNHALTREDTLKSSATLQMKARVFSEDPSADPIAPGETNGFLSGMQKNQIG